MSDEGGFLKAVGIIFAVIFGVPFIFFHACFTEPLQPLGVSAVQYVKMVGGFFLGEGREEGERSRNERLQEKLDEIGSDGFYEKTLEFLEGGRDGTLSDAGMRKVKRELDDEADRVCIGLRGENARLCKERFLFLYFDRTISCIQKMRLNGVPIETPDDIDFLMMEHCRDEVMDTVVDARSYAKSLRR